MQVEPELMVFACTSGSFYKGPGWTREIAKHITKLAGVPALVTSTAVKEALHAVGARRLFLMTPYPEVLNTLEVAFFEWHGFEFVHQVRLETGLARDIGNVEPSTIFDALVAREKELEDADTILLSCTALRAVEVISRIERRFGKPVISSNQATAWAIMRSLAVEAEDRPGALFYSDLKANIPVHGALRAGFKDLR